VKATVKTVTETVQVKKVTGLTLTLESLEDVRALRVMAHFLTTDFYVDGDEDRAIAKFAENLDEALKAKGIKFPRQYEDWDEE
jgi:hypothetical protein